MTWSEFFAFSSVTEFLACILMLIGAVLSLLAAIGLFTFPDILSRMHSSAKPQILGLFLMLAGLAIDIGQPVVWGMIVLTFLMQVMTVPVGAHIVGRTTFRAKRVDTSTLLVDELSPASETKSTK